MEVKNVDNKISFGYKTLLRDLWMKGELPTVKYGLYRKKLTKNATKSSLQKSELQT